MKGTPRSDIEGNLVNRPQVNFDEITEQYQARIFLLLNKVFQQYSEIEDVIKLTIPSKQREILKREAGTLVARLPLRLDIDFMKLSGIVRGGSLLDNLFKRINEISTNTKAIDKMKIQIARAHRIYSWIPASTKLDIQTWDTDMSISELKELLLRYGVENQRIGIILKYLQENSYINSNGLIDINKLKDFSLGKIDLGFDIVMKRVITRNNYDVARKEVNNYKAMSDKGVNMTTALSYVVSEDKIDEEGVSQAHTSFTFFDSNIEFFKSWVFQNNIFQRPPVGEVGMLERLWVEVAKIHAAGAIHGDLHFGNIGLEMDAQGRPIIFIDPTRGRTGIPTNHDSFINLVKHDLSVFGGQALGSEFDRLSDEGQPIDIEYIKECIVTYVKTLQSLLPADDFNSLGGFPNVLAQIYSHVFNLILRRGSN